MAEGLFDGRYRYDYIYPRGRSGETLRAVDTQSGDRPVVIKRPAPNDAPPIRAGQEVSILNERKALKRLSGHPVLTALLDSGEFVVGGTAHQYIVMERGEGLIVADEVLELAGRGERLPLLEMLVIIEHLLDLLQTAHTRDVVYNDVDAKHLFWSRETYRLKVIDWGNAVFLEGDEITPQGVSRLSDIYQTGELLYFILTGGGRPDVPRDAGGGWEVRFEEDDDIRTPDGLQAVVSKALHPNPRLRYGTIAELRRDLATQRAPLERERDSILARVHERLRRDRSRDELHGLMDTLRPALRMDPGYPAARNAEREIEDRLSDLQISADLDAVFIYIESANWERAASVLDELRSKARGSTAKLVGLLLDTSLIMLDAETDTPPAVLDAVAMMFEGEVEKAAQTLVTNDADTLRAQSLQLLIAERITSHMPDVLLLRPNLFRLAMALRDLEKNDGLRLTEPIAILDEVDVRLEASGDVDNLSDLRDVYRGVVDSLTALTTLIEAVNVGLPDRRLPLSSLNRATNAAMQIADSMHIVGRQAAEQPRDALHALDTARAIDPTNPAWDTLRDLLNDLYRLLESYQTYVPVADGSDLRAWLLQAVADLEPFTGRLFDDMLAEMVGGLQTARTAWDAYATTTLTGDRTGAVDALTEATDAVTTISPTLAGWFNQLRSVVQNANYIERHALDGTLGRALADGWESFDEGRLGDAERLGEQAKSVALTDEARTAAERLHQLATLARGWNDRNGVYDAKRTADLLESVEALFNEGERRTLDDFTKQMPSRETYLRAMGKGLVELYRRRSTAAVRSLFTYYVMQGVLDAHENLLEDTQFWRQAALQTLGQHTLIDTLDTYVKRQQDLAEAAEALNALNGRHAIETTEDVRILLEDGTQAKPLSQAIHSLREIENALPDWSNGEFKTAALKLENAVKAIDEAIATTGIDAAEYRNWLDGLRGTAANLATAKRTLLDAIAERPKAPTPEITEGHRTLLFETIHAIGEDYASTLRLWNDTYTAFAGVMTDESARRSARLTRFNELFRAMFIDRQPAYPLYRHWYEVTERSAEFPAPPTDEPMPQIRDEPTTPLQDWPEDIGFDDEYDDDPTVPTDEAEVEPAPRARGRRSRSTIVVAVLGIVALAVAGGYFVVNGFSFGGSPSIAVTISATPTDPSATEAPTEGGTDAIAAALAEENDATEVITTPPTEPAPTTAAPETTAAPTDDLSSATPTETETPTPTATPTLTFTPSNTPTPSITPTPTATATPTVPANGVRGQRDLLAVVERLTREDPAAMFWEPDRFSVNPDGESWRLGIGADTADEVLLFAPPASLFESYYGAAVQSFQVTMDLATFNPTLLESDEVYFGALLVPVGTAAVDGAGVRIDVVQPGVINISQQRGAEAEFLTQRAVNAITVRIRVDHDPNTGTLTTFLNDAVIGQTVPLAGDDMLPLLFVKDGGVIVNITTWDVTLR